MRWFISRNEFPQALRMATRLRALAPSDEEAAATIEQIGAFPKVERVTVPPEGWER